VFGAVYRPASFLIGQDGERIRDYVARAGGPIRAADRGQIFVVRANGDVLTRKAGALDARALPGDLVFMPVRTQGNSLLAKLRDISTIAFQFGITAAALAVLIR
jgi:protein involved in polysaccharide export with SLBB domain